MKIAFVCDTPLQILNMLQFIEDNREKDNLEIDVFLYHQFRGSRGISGRLKQEKVISNVYDISVFKQYPSFVQKFITFVRIVFPKRFLRKYIEGKKSVLREEYDRLIMCFPTTLCISLRLLYPRAELLLLEDGIGTYISDLSKDYYPYALKVLSKLTKNEKYIINPQKAYVRIPNMMLDNVDYSLSKLGKKTCKVEILDRVFGYKNNMIYKNKKLVYLTQPLEEKDGYKRYTKGAIYDLIDEYRDDYVVRCHPRDNEDSGKAFEKDKYNNLWELECIHQISSNHILMGAFSTAQLMPKILKDEEPYLIFIYKLFFENVEEDEFWCETGRFIEDFRRFYKDKGKIFVPASVPELREILTKIL